MNKYRATETFAILPGYEVDNQFQYPDMLTLATEPHENLQPMSLGSNKFGFRAQFGELEPLMLGRGYERRNAGMQMTLNQSDPEQKVAVIEFSWRMYENEEHQLFFYRFVFKGRDGKSLGSIQNMADNVFQETVRKGGFRLCQKKKSAALVEEEEVIAAVKLGLRQTSSIVNVQFIIGKL